MKNTHFVTFVTCDICDNKLFQHMDLKGYIIYIILILYINIKYNYL